MLPVTGAEVRQDAGVSQTTGPGLVLEEGLGQVLLLCHLMIMIVIVTMISEVKIVEMKMISRISKVKTT